MYEDNRDMMDREENGRTVDEPVRDDSVRAGQTENGAAASGQNGSGAPNGGPRPQDTGRRIIVDEPKKGLGTGAKVGIAVLVAAVFGLAVGGSMAGVSRLSASKNAAEVTASAEAGNAGGTEAQSEAAEKKTVKSPAGKTAEEQGLKIGRGTTTPAPQPVSPVQNTALDVSGIVEKAMPSVVAINVKGEMAYSDWWGHTQIFETSGAGSGILIGENDTEYLIVTNNHVVADATSVSVQFIDETSVDALVKGTDSEKDLAVVAVVKDDVSEDTKKAIQIAEIGDSDALKVGQGVIAIGNALGYGQSVTVGYVSALNREIKAYDSTTGATDEVKGLLQTDAAINPGNSGGALLDMDGRVIGINESKSVSESVEGIGFAIPISSAYEVISNLSLHETRVTVDEEKRGYLGIQGQNVGSDISEAFSIPEGVYVYKILEDGGAADSDLKEKDIITKLDGQSIKSMEELQQTLTKYEVGETVELQVMRPEEDGGYTELTVEVTLKDHSSLGSDAQSGKQQDGGNSGNGGNGGNSGNGASGGGYDPFGMPGFGGFSFGW